jgi:hypothetical protein
MSIPSRVQGDVVHDWCTRKTYHYFQHYFQYYSHYYSNLSAHAW